MRFVLDAYNTEHAVYGLVLVTALIAVGWKFDTDLEVLLFIVGTVGVFWLTHVYAVVVAGRRSAEGRAVPIGRAVARAALRSVGMLLAMLLPALALGLATLGWVDEYVAYYVALWIGIASLAVIGWVNSSRNRGAWYLRLLSAATTMVLGLAVIWLSSLVH
ncbi:hypothetical protein ASE14_16175 [Agromyces sp. Root81]|uniref:hypothetical protein n=1 Tax=Agromyces sp. Root81 TaxID=1736601 RepID=UPI0006FD5D92|nr:hypothetical protein [Agromyces sp. Root81]KRC59290.1 hypothetical protein ASE14_16175 [Agromyces sp. Root81]